MLFHIFISVIFLHSYVAAFNSCNRFCKVTLREGYTNVIKENNINILNPEVCSHLIIDAYIDDELNQIVLKKAYSHLQKTNISSKTKIFVHLRTSLLHPSNDKFSHEVQKIFDIFDGFHIQWDNEYFSDLYKFHENPLNIKQNIINNFLKDFRNSFKNKIIVVTVGADPTIWEYFDFVVFKETVDFIALRSRQSLQYLYEQNVFGARVIQSGGTHIVTTWEESAKKWILGGFPKNRMLIFIDESGGPFEPRIKTIWSSLNNFGGIFLDQIQMFKDPFKKLNEMVDKIQKFEEIQICDASTKTTIKQFLCYFSLNIQIDKTENNYRNCDKIILKDANSDIMQNLNNISAEENEKLENFIEHFRGSNLTDVVIIVSFNVKTDFVETAKDDDEYQKDAIKQIASNVLKLIQQYNLNGIELICDESTNIEAIEKLILPIYSKSSNIEIGLQINVFKIIPSKFVSIMNNVTWITHAINSLNDPELSIFYQWNKLHEAHGLNRSKVILKISPGIWQQTAAYPYPSFDSDLKMEKENPENDVILNRKYLCLNETLKQNIQSSTLTYLPMIFTVHENFEKRKQRILREKKGDTTFMLQFFMMAKVISTDLFYIRYETKETIVYKIRIAEKYGFGGISLNAINVEDDENEICGKSIFKEMIEIIKDQDLI